MKFIILFIALVYINGLSTDNFEVIMENLKSLEDYMKLYIKEKSSEQSLTHLITCYIREGAYSSSEWKIAGGTIPDDLPKYIEEKDSLLGTNAHLCKTYKDIELPNNEKIDFVHFFAVMNGIEHGDSYSDNFAHLVGWGGDTCQLFEDIKNEKGDLETLKNITKTKYFLISGQFGLTDFISDLDAPIILKKKSDKKYFSDIIKEYYNGKEYSNRITNFNSLTFPKIEQKDLSEKIFEIYSNDQYIKILECKSGLREEGILGCYSPGKVKEQYINHQSAAVFTVSDYLSQYNNNNNDNNTNNNGLKIRLNYIIFLLSLLFMVN